MDRWWIDIIRQQGLDWWTCVCLAAAGLLILYAIARRLWNSNLGLSALILAAVVGTIAILCLPSLRSPQVGLVWTAGLLTLLAGTFYLSLRPSIGASGAWVLLVLRVTALVMLVAMLFEPVLRYESAAPPRRPLIVMVDASGSMSFTDAPNGPTRIQSAWQALRPQLDRIDENFVPQFFAFSTGVSALKNPQDLDTTPADGKATDLVAAVRGAAAASSDPDTVVLLISDGQDNVNADVPVAVRELNRKVSTLTVGSDQAESTNVPNVAVDSVDCGDDCLVGHDNPITATIRSSALTDRLVDVKLAEIDDAGKPIGEIESKPLVLQSDAAGQRVVLNYKPQTSGIHRLAVWIDPIPGERTTAGNRQEVQLLALDPRIKVLYIEGRLRPEYTYLHRLLERDPNLEASTLLRLHDNEFTAGDQSAMQLRGLPITLSDWKSFDVVILGDLDGSFLSSTQESSLEQAVSQGMGLVMIGGENNFSAGGYSGTPVEKALPVWMDSGGANQEKSDFLPQLTADGLTNPILTGLTDDFVSPNGTTPQNAPPPLRGNVAVGAAKEGAQVLLIHPGDHPQIVLAVQRYGSGRSAAFTADTTYLWNLADPGQNPDSVYDRFWGQLIRWLAGADVRNRQAGPGVTGLLDKSIYQFGQPVRLRALVRDERGLTTETAQVSVMEHPASDSSSSRKLTLAPSPNRAGMYEITLPDPAQDIKSLPSGDYVLELTAEKDGTQLGTQELKFAVVPPADEMEKLAANPQLMSQIAEATGGFSGSLDALPNILDALIRSDPSAHQIQQKALPLDNFVRVGLAAVGSRHQWADKFDLPMQAGMVITLLAVEWVLRRRWELR